MVQSLPVEPVASTLAARPRNVWGWGHQDAFPSESMRELVATRLRETLGFQHLCLRPLPRPEDARLHAPRLSLSALPSALQAVCTTDALERMLHTYGKNFRDQIRGFTGDYYSAPDLIAYPRQESEIGALLEWAESNKVMVIPFGGGTSVVGGVERPSSGHNVPLLSLDLRHLNRVLEVDTVSRTARIQGGTFGPDIERQLHPHGLTLRHYPQSFEFSTLGGWLATRSAGHYATLHTHIDEFVQSIRMVTPRGIWESRRLPGSGAGPNPDRLVLGSEGILGVITEAWMRLQVRPRFRMGASVRFERFDDAVAAARAIAQAGLYPANCRVLSRNEALLNSVVDEPCDLLILGFESADHPVDAAMERALELCFACGGIDPNGPTRREDNGQKDAASSWKNAFFEGPYLQSALLSMGAVVDTFETAITWEKFPALHAELVEGLNEAIRSKCGRGIVTCRFTHVYPDGPAPYYTFIAEGSDGSDRDVAEQQLERWWYLKTVASDILNRNGATITHHHAIGRLHRPWYDRERPDLFALALGAAKAAVDPNGILNPGVLIGA